MKVLHINFNYNVSSLYRHFSESLIGNGCDITVYHPTTKNSGTDKLEKFLDIDPILNKYDRYFYNQRNRKVVERLEDKYDINNFNLLHAHSLFSNGNIAYSIKRKYGIPYIVAIRDTDLNLFFKKRVLLRNKGIKILNEASQIILLSKPYKELLMSKYIPPKYKNTIESKIKVIPNGIDPFWLKNPNMSKNTNKKDKIKILSVGVINRRKNSLTTAKACKLLQEKTGLDVELLLVGEIKDYKYFKKVQSYNLVRHISYQEKERLLMLYRDSDIFVLPSITETFGLVYAEAISQSLPVIYSKGQGFDKQFEDGEVGYSVSSKNVDDIVDKMKMILENRDSLSRNCNNLVSNFSWNKISKEYIAIYKRLLNVTK